MRQLRFVRVDDDGGHVLLESSETGEQYALPVDSALRDAIRSDLPRLSRAGEPDMPITPREIQVRVRSGHTPESVAEEHGIPLERVMRFAAPVLAERIRVADEARRARARLTNGGAASVEFGATVDERFIAHGIGLDEVHWDARRREDGQWTVKASWERDGSDWHAEWSINLAARQVSPLDDTAADLLSDRPIRPIDTELPPRAIVAVPAPGQLGIVSFPAMPEADTGELPAVEQLFDQAAFDYDIEPEPAPQPTARLAHPHVPSWDEVLLGVRRKRDSK